MRKTYCDICGEEIRKSQWMKLLANHVEGATATDRLGSPIMNEDVCKDCLQSLSHLKELLALKKGDLMALIQQIQQTKLIPMKVFLAKSAVIGETMRMGGCGVTWSLAYDNYFDYLMSAFKDDKLARKNLQHSLKRLINLKKDLLLHYIELENMEQSKADRMASGLETLRRIKW